MIFTAYFDESDTHGPEPDIILSGFLASARQWELFERRLKEMQRRYGFNIFHATEFRNRRGEFSGWSDAKSEHMLTELAQLISAGLKEAVSMSLPHALYKAEYRSQPTPNGMHVDSQYGVCFRFAIHKLVQIILADKKRHKLNVVIEDGHKNVGDTLRIFKELKGEYAGIGIDVLGLIKVASKDDAPPLMIADFQAHLSALSGRLVRSGERSYDSMAAAYPMPRKNEAGMTTVAFTAESLRGVKENWREEKEARQAKWRAARERRQVEQ